MGSGAPRYRSARPCGSPRSPSPSASPSLARPATSPPACGRRCPRTTSCSGHWPQAPSRATCARARTEGPPWTPCASCARRSAGRAPPAGWTSTRSTPGDRAFDTPRTLHVRPGAPRAPWHVPCPRHERSRVSTLQIRIFGDPVLRQRAHEVTDFDGRLAKLAQDMLDTMRAKDGVGLAANQVGVLKRLFTWELDVGEDEEELIGGAVVNPVLLDSSEELQEGDEGCLSFPGLFYPVDRPLRIEVEHRDLHGDEHTVQLEGFLARIFLHEMDHLNGILFIDHLAKHDRKEAMRRMREQQLEGGPPPTAGALLLGQRNEP
ncbi:peptide deformylase [Nitriliruptoraceae bacterium ZYF776]|nr:peptide deformylase [Profundirhabdus halotolerans]